MKEQRRLAAIVSADAAGYSRLRGRDESGTLGALKAFRREIVDPQIASHGGRIVKTTDDGLLLEFPSMIDAVGCAVEVPAVAAGAVDVQERLCAEILKLQLHATLHTSIRVASNVIAA
jgi:adenylate cyclase